MGHYYGNLNYLNYGGLLPSQEGNSIPIFPQVPESLNVRNCNSHHEQQRTGEYTPESR